MGQRLNVNIMVMGLIFICENELFSFSEKAESRERRISTLGLTKPDLIYFLIFFSLFLVVQQI